MKSYDSNTPEVFAGAVAFTFVLVAIVFFVYDMFVQRRNTKLVEKAAQSNAVISSMFPGAIRDRLIGPDAETEQQRKSKGNLKTFLTDSHTGDGARATKEKPLADLFLETTVSAMQGQVL